MDCTGIAAVVGNGIQSKTDNNQGQILLQWNILSPYKLHPGT
jgi:hypothetical protein